VLRRVSARGARMLGAQTLPRTMGSDRRAGAPAPTPRGVGELAASAPPRDRGRRTVPLPRTRVSTEAQAGQPAYGMARLGSVVAASGDVVCAIRSDEGVGSLHERAVAMGFGHVVTRARCALGSTAVIVLGSAGGLSDQASAATSGGLTATIPIAPPPVKSVTVSATSETFGSCTGTSTTALSFPNGHCNTPSVTVSNDGPTAEQIYVQGSDAVPADGGTHWTLCSVQGSAAPPCPGGTSGAPGVNQFFGATGSVTSATPLALSAQCDVGFQPSQGGTCNASPGQVGAAESLLMEGPSQTSDTSPTFTTTITWTAV
jgi:hypothetical protein